MTTFSAKWSIFGCILLIAGGVSSDTFVYAGRAALQSYSPARGEFPVLGLFGRGYFSYIDQDGNSRIVSLDPNPLLGVRVSTSGQPLLESQNAFALENQPKMHGQEQISRDKDDKENKDRLKPIKEFDEHPFVDTTDVIIPDLSVQATNPKTEIPRNQATPSGPSVKQFISSQSVGFSPTNPFLPLIFPDPSPPTKPGTVVLRPSQTSTSGQIWPHPQPPASGTAGQNPFLPQNAGFVFLNPKPPTNLGSVVLNPSPPNCLQQVIANSKLDTNSGAIASSASEIVLPNSQATAGSGVFSNIPLPPTVTSNTTSPILDLQSTGTAFPAPSPMSIFVNSATTRPQILNACISSGTTSPPPQIIGAGNVFSPSEAVINPPSSVFNNPSTTQGLPQNPLPPCSGTTATAPSFITAYPQFNVDKRNPFLPQRIPESTTLTPAEIEAVVTNFDIKSSTSGLDINSDIDEAAFPEQVTDTPEVEAAKREHFLAHELALAQLALAQQQGKQEDDSSSSSLLTSASDSSSVYLPSEAAESFQLQAVTSGPSTVVITEQTKVTAPASDTVS